ncbi:MAG: hypothetical protein NWE90_02140, partial [Candidatus Bathyarchaeota archaeon]|nr:hypothetical protein [Candidatus Bathyarchaeota archaeon]
TITRTRAFLEKELIDGYTIIPKWEKLGYGITAFTFITSKAKYTKYKEKQAAISKVRGWLMKNPNVLFSAAGQGLGWTGLTISVHKNYADFMEFKGMHDSELGDIVDDAQTFIVSTNRASTMKPFHLKYLANRK